MKKLILSFMVILSFSTANASLKYECSRYIDGNYKGWTTVLAENKEEAETKALIKFKDELNKKVDYVKCK